MRVPTLLVALSLIWPAGSTARLEARSQRVSFTTEDGITIVATWHEPSYRPAPAVILVHMLGRSRRDWDPVAQRLASSGIGALAIDLRGHGDSAFHGTTGDATDYSIMRNDVRAARRYLSARSDVQPARVGMAGASIGASLAVLEASSDTTIASIALLSPSMDYRGLRIDAAARKYGNRPMLLVSSDDDGYARRSALELQKTGANRELLGVTAAGHGTNMLSRAEELPDALVEWFRRTLK